MKYILYFLIGAIVALFFNACTQMDSIFMDQTESEVNDIVALFSNNQERLYCNNQNTKKIKNDMISFLITYFTKEEIHEIYLFCNLEKTKILMRRIKEFPDDQNLKKELAEDASANISKETLGKISSREFTKGLNDVFSQSINEACTNE